MNVYWISKHTLNIKIVEFFACPYRITQLENSLGKKQLTLPLQLNALSHPREPHSTYTQCRLSGEICSWLACTVESIRMQLSHLESRHAAMPWSQQFSQMEWQSWGKQKWDNLQLSNQCAWKISLLVDDPSTTSWRRSREDLPPLCLHNRGHKGENMASLITSPQTPFFITTLYLITTDNCLI